MKNLNYQSNKNEYAALCAAHKKLYPHLYRYRAGQDKKRKKAKHPFVTVVSNNKSSSREFSDEELIDIELRINGYYNLPRYFASVKDFYFHCRNSRFVTAEELEVFEQIEWMESYYFSKIR